jgi:hypothetical protein
MTQRSPYKFILVPQNPRNSGTFLALKRVQIHGSDLPSSSEPGNRIHSQKSENSVRHMESGNGNSIFGRKEVSA